MIHVSSSIPVSDNLHFILFFWHSSRFFYFTRQFPLFLPYFLAELHQVWISFFICLIHTTLLFFCPLLVSFIFLLYTIFFMPFIPTLYIIRLSCMYLMMYAGAFSVFMCLIAIIHAFFFRKEKVIWMNELIVLVITHA
jgi:hypothetical protein